MTPIEPPKHPFHDNDGNLLNNGYIYIGQPNTAAQNPVNQKTVTFRDAGGGEFTAQQPLRTINGKISYNGQPITALVEGNHSMLILDSAESQVDYIGLIEAAAVVEGDSGSIQVGLLLSDIKAFDVSVGEVVRNVGELTAIDDNGADWLVVSATGSPGDDVDLIDFDNGLQGVRDKSKVYRREGVGTFILDPPVSVVSTNDATAYRNTWTNINLSSGIPTGADSAILRASVSADYPNNTISNRISSNASARKSGSSAAFPEAAIGRATNMTNANEIIGIEYVGEFTVALDPESTPTFDFSLVVNDPFSTSNNTTPDLDIVIVGYTINQE